MQIHFVGYFEGKPSRADVRFFHRNQVLAFPTIDVRQPSPREIKIAGSDIVANLLFETEDLRFAPYRKAREQNFTLAEATEVARNYIRACSHPIGRALDEKCEGIGGQIHIATVNPGEGFRWIDPPVSDP